MPQALVVFIGAVAGAIITGLTAVGFSLAASVAILNFGIQLAGLALLNSIYNHFFLPDIGRSAQSFTVTVRGTIEHSRIIYGETLSSGLIWYMNAAGTNNQALYYAIAVAGHEVSNMTDMWLDDNRIPEAAIDWAGNGAVTSGDYRGDVSEQAVVYFNKYYGGDSQLASPILTSAFGEVNSSHAGRGVAYFVARLDYFDKQTQVWSSGAPDNLRALVRGKKVYDPRKDFGLPDLYEGSGAHSQANSPSWQWSDNPALCWADYMVDSRLGFNISQDKIDWNYVASAATVCDEVLYTPVGTDVRFSCNGTLSTGDAHDTNLKRILASMNGTAALVNGLWKVRAYSFATPTHTFGDDDMRGDIKINLHPTEKERYNHVRGTFIDKDRLWKSSDFPEFTSSEYLSRDNDRILYRDVSFHMTKDIYQAQRLAAGILEQSDNEITAVLPTNFHTLPVEVGGTLNLNNEKLGWVDKTFRINRYKFNDMGGIDLVVREDSAAAYVDVSSNEYTTLSNSGNYIVASPGVPPPSSLSAAGIVDGFNINTTPPAARLYETINIYANAISNSRDQAVLISKIKNTDYFYPVTSDSIHYFWAQAENYLGELSDYFPNSDQSNIFDSVNTAIWLTQVECTQNIAIPDQSSGWALSGRITGPTVNAGGAAPIKVDVTLEVNIGHSTPQINDTLRMRWAVDRGGNKSGFGPEKSFPVNSLGGLFTFKGLYETTVNTDDIIEATFLATHNETTFHEITHWAMTTKVVPDTTATSNPGPNDEHSKQILDMVSVGDTIVVQRRRNREQINSLTVTDSAEVAQGFVLSLDGQNIQESLASGPATAGIRFNADGTVDQRKSTGYSRIDSVDWITPATDASSRFSIRRTNETITDGSYNLVESAADSNWIHMGSNREFSGRDSNPAIGNTVEIITNFEIRDDDGEHATVTGSYRVLAFYWEDL